MKKTIILLFACSVALTGIGHTSTFFRWSSTQHDFGTISQGEAVSHTFEFINTSSEPLVITAVRASCGCTVADYSKDPIAPGTHGHIKATFNAEKLGTFLKTITIQSNANENPVLTLKGLVVK